MKMENSTTVQPILEKLDFVNRQFHRLLLIAGASERARENIAALLSVKIPSPLININLEVSRQLLELPEKQRPFHLPGILDTIINSITQPTFIFKNIELLFNATLKTDPLRLFMNISRNKTLIVAWNGHSDGEFLFYAAPGHPDYKKYPTADLNIINLHDEF
jgi:hypothetical protein